MMYKYYVNTVKLSHFVRKYRFKKNNNKTSPGEYFAEEFAWLFKQGQKETFSIYIYTN